jgi:glutamate synthase (NADPH/NADH) small chain
MTTLPEKPQRPPRQKDASIPDAERRTTFKEVPLGFTPEQAMAEASRCLQCRRPRCVEGCPVNVPIKDFIQLVTQGDFIAASKKIKEKNALPAVCGRVCPQEDQCEKACVLGRVDDPVAIGKLERFVADYEAVHGSEPTPSSQPRMPRRVAVIGAGPAGLTCAAELAQMGYRVTVFESLHEPGGVLVYGIPEFRLPKDIVKREVEYITKLGVEFALNVPVGAALDVSELREQGYDAIFIGVGAGLPIMLDIPGENAVGVYTANEYLTRVNLMRAYAFPEYDTPVSRGKNVIVIGGGNVALDAARTALRLGAESVTIAYRRTEAEMPARREEIEHAREEGIAFEFLVAPVEILTENNRVSGVRFQRMELSEPDESGRRRPVPIPGSFEALPADLVITAIGTRANPLLPRNIPGLELTERGYIKADEEGRTSLPYVFAGGDIVTGAATVILAMGAGKKAARAIDRYLRSLDESSL